MAVFFEDFKASPLDSAVWLISDGYSNPDPLFDCAWSAASVSVDPSGNGILTASLFPNAALTPPNSGGEIRTLADCGYGLYEASMKVSPVAGVNTAFYVYTGPYYGNPWDEVDLEFATFGPSHDHVKLQCNYFTNGVGGHEILVELGFDPSAAFHTYAFEWLPNSIKWSVDGAQVAQATTGLPTTPGHTYLNIWPPAGVTDWTGGPYDGTPTSSQVDWIRFTPNNVARNKRAAMMGLDAAYRVVLPSPDSAISVEDRYQLAGNDWLAAVSAAALIFRNRTGDRFRLTPSFPC